MCRVWCNEVEIGRDVGPSSTGDRFLREVNGIRDWKG
jgi:hypothetical protein